MRVRILTASLAVVIGCGTLGCKSAPKMSWWSSKDTAKTETTAVAHAAPQLPSEIAKQSEAINTANPVQISTAPAFATTSNTGGTAPAFAATTAPAGAYPSTGAQSYVPTTTSQAAASAASTIASSNTLPYNPNAVPAAKTPPNVQSIAATPSAGMNSSAPADRYGNSYAQSTASFTATTPTTNAAPTTQGTLSAAADSYPNFSSPTNTHVASPTSAGSNVLGDRYAMSSSPSVAAPAMSAPSESQQVQTASAIASTEPYRPGGTGTYPAMAASNARYEVASRPSAPTGSQSTVPNVAYPSTGANQYR